MTPLAQVLRFGLVGAVNTGVSVGLILLLHDGLGLPLLPVTLVAYAAGVATSFVLNRAWTFGATGRVRVQLPLFLLVNACGAALYAAGVMALSRSMSTLYASTLCIVLVFCFNFVASKLLVFRTRQAGRL